MHTTVLLRPDVHGLWCVTPKVHRGLWCMTWREISSWGSAWIFLADFGRETSVLISEKILLLWVDVHWDPWCMMKHIYLQFMTHRDVLFEHPVESAVLLGILCLTCIEILFIFLVWCFGTTPCLMLLLAVNYI